jgi:hypothetical protein
VASPMPTHDAFCIYSRNHSARDVRKLEIRRNRLSQPSYISNEYLSLLEKDIACLVSTVTLHAQPHFLLSLDRFPFELFDGNIVFQLRPMACPHEKGRATLICTTSSSVERKKSQYTFKRKFMDNVGGKDLSARHLIAKFGEEDHAVYGLGTIPFEDAPAIMCDMRDHVATVVSRLLGIDIMINNRGLRT